MKNIRKIGSSFVLIFIILISSYGQYIFIFDQTETNCDSSLLVEDKPIQKKESFPMLSDSNNWPSIPGEFLIDVGYSFIMYYGSWDPPGLYNWEKHRMKVSLNGGTPEEHISYSQSEDWRVDGTFTLDTNTYFNNINFELKEWLEWWIFRDQIDLKEAVDIGYPDPIADDVTFEFEGSTVGWGIVWNYIHAFVHSLNFDKDFLDSNEELEISFTIDTHISTSLFVPGYLFVKLTGAPKFVYLERRIGSTGTWQTIKTWENLDMGQIITLTHNENIDFISSSEFNKEVYYRVLLEGDHYRYRSMESYRVMVNPNKPFISKFSVVLDKEKWDSGLISPTEIFHIEGEIHNPTNDITNIMNLQCNRFFSNQWENEIDFIEIGTLNPHETKSFIFQAPNQNDITKYDSTYIIPGWNYSVDDNPMNDIELKEWNWYNEDTGEIHSTSRGISFEVWIQGKEEESKLSMELPMFIPSQKKAYAHFNQKYYEIYSNIEEVIKTCEDVGAAATIIGGIIGAVGVAALIFGGPVGAIVGGICTVVGAAVSAVGVGALTVGLLAEIINWFIKAEINSNNGIIKDPPDPNIYELEEIVYEPIDPLIENITITENLRDLYNFAKIQKTLVDIGKAIKTTNERYMYASIKGINDAAQLQANTLKDYSLIQTNQINSYISSLEGIFNNTTPEAIIIGEGYSYNDICKNYSLLREYVSYDSEFYQEIREMLIEANYSESEIDEMNTSIIEFDLNNTNQQIEQKTIDFNADAQVIANDTTEIIDALINGAEEMVNIAKNPDSKTEFSTISNQYGEIVKIEFNPSTSSLNNGETTTFELKIENLLEKSMTYDIIIERLKDISSTSDLAIDPSCFIYEKSITLGPLESQTIPIIINIPSDTPPMVINPIVSVITTHNNEIFNKTKSFMVKIKDDDITPPELLLIHKGDGTDGQPGTIEFKIEDPNQNSEATGTLIIEGSNGILYSENFIEGIYSIDLNQVPIFELGEYIATLTAENNDEDGWEGDEEMNSVSISFTIEDDDKYPPDLTELDIAHDIHNIEINLYSSDYSGIEEFKIFVNGILIVPSMRIQDGNTYTFILENQWILRTGIYEVEIQAIDADNDRPNDALTSSIYGSFEITLAQMYDYVDWQLEELKTYIDENLCYRLSRCLIWKLTRAQNRLHEAFTLVENGDITCGLYHDKIAKIFVQIIEFRIEIYNKRCCISDEHTEYIIDTLHAIRNNIVILMGASTGSEQAYDIAYIEVDLLNLSDFIEEEIICCTGKYLSRKVYCASKMLEIAIFKISMDKDIKCLLKCTQWKLERVIWKINWYLDKGRIPEDLANYLIDEITRINEAIDQVIIG